MRTEASREDLPELTARLVMRRPGEDGLHDMGWPYVELLDEDSRVVGRLGSVNDEIEVSVDQGDVRIAMGIQLRGLYRIEGED